MNALFVFSPTLKMYFAWSNVKTTVGSVSEEVVERTEAVHAMCSALDDEERRENIEENNGLRGGSGLQRDINTGKEGNASLAKKKRRLNAVNPRSKSNLVEVGGRRVVFCLSPSSELFSPLFIDCS